MSANSDNLDPTRGKKRPDSPFWNEDEKTLEPPYIVWHPNASYPPIPFHPSLPPSSFYFPYADPTIVSAQKRFKARNRRRFSFRRALDRVLDGVALVILGVAVLISIAEGSFLPFLATFFILSLVKSLTSRKSRTD